MVSNIVPWGISAVSLLFVILTFYRNVSKDGKGEMEQIKESLIKANVKLDQVFNTTNETRSDIKAMNAKIQSIDKELEIVKRDVATAFVRIDEIKDKLNEQASSVE